MREVLRIEQPSTRAETTATRSEVLRTFAILSIIRERSGIVKTFRRDDEGEVADLALD
jgi:hypothetical protein